MVATREERAKEIAIPCPACGEKERVGQQPIEACWWKCFNCGHTTCFDSEIELRAAAQAVIDRWDTPNWKDVESTASFINRLRDALDKKPMKGVSDTDLKR